MPAIQPDYDTAVKVVAILGGSEALGTTVFVGKVRRPGNGVPSLATFCESYAGPEPEPYFGGSAKSFNEYRVKITVRGARNGEAAGQEKARTILDGLHLKTLSGYVGVYALQPDPVSMPLDGLGRPSWMFNLRLTRKAQQ